MCGDIEPYADTPDVEFAEGLPGRYRWRDVRFHRSDECRIEEGIDGPRPTSLASLRQSHTDALDSSH
ncbi:hypothetical protein C9J85_18540 [Haloferax sp. wsp5]|nr:hypothetical protein C9J85_18540 [Haloferax sp. wsp5]